MLFIPTFLFPVRCPFLWPEKSSLTRLPYRLLRVRASNFQQIFMKFSVTVVTTMRDQPHPRCFFFSLPADGTNMADAEPRHI